MTTQLLSLQEWLQQVWESVPAQKKTGKPGPYRSANRKTKLTESVAVLDGGDRLISVTAGTEVCIYQSPARAKSGAIATLFCPDGTQLSVMPGNRVIDRTPSTQGGVRPIAVMATSTI